MEDQRLIRFLAEKVLGWQVEQNSRATIARGADGTVVCLDGHSSCRYWNSLDSWADAGMLWEKVPFLSVRGLMCTPTGPKYSTSLYDKNAKFIHVWADTVPLVISKALATAFGYEWL